MKSNEEVKKGSERNDSESDFTRFLSGSVHL